MPSSGPVCPAVALGAQQWLSGSDSHDDSAFPDFFFHTEQFLWKNSVKDVDNILV